MDDQWTNPNPAPADPAQPATEPAQEDPNAGGQAPAWTPPAEPAEPAPAPMPEPAQPEPTPAPAEPAWTPETPAQEAPAPQPGGSWDQGGNTGTDQPAQ